MNNTGRSVTKSPYRLYASLAGIIVMLACIYGWIANIVKLFGADFVPLSGEVVLRAIGVFVSPLGAVLGYF